MDYERCSRQSSSERCARPRALGAVMHVPWHVRVVKRQGMARRLRRVPNAAAARVNGGRAIYEAAVGGRGDAPWRLALIISLARVSLCMSREPSYLLDPACRRTVSLVSPHSVRVSACIAFGPFI